MPQTTAKYFRIQWTTQTKLLNLLSFPPNEITYWGHKGKSLLWRGRRGRCCWSSEVQCNALDCWGHLLSKSYWKRRVFVKTLGRMSRETTGLRNSWPCFRLSGSNEIIWILFRPTSGSTYISSHGQLISNSTKINYVGSLWTAHAKLTTEALKRMINDDSFKAFYETVLKRKQSLVLSDVSEPELPRKRRASAPFEVGQGVPSFLKTSEELYRRVYFEALDLIIASITERRFDQPNFKAYMNMESLLLGAACYLVRPLRQI